ncbi:hypothetical protein BSIN_1795 [Burkholderia singularis]|uniref:Uncharacterized protein n=1 Tax=Burkholderia singularis TaxID=1503053 RepID=A0A238GZV6_9BURK|nr:hypothetical protein BSIN_1795 [Burkholderia singularis]
MARGYRATLSDEATEQSSNHATKATVRQRGAAACFLA